MLFRKVEKLHDSKLVKDKMKNVEVLAGKGSMICC